MTDCNETVKTSLKNWKDGKKKGGVEMKCTDFFTVSAEKHPSLKHYQVIYTSFTALNQYDNIYRCFYKHNFAFFSRFTYLSEVIKYFLNTIPK